MKKTLLTVAVLIASAGVLAQGTVNFTNLPSQVGSQQPVFEADGATPLAGEAYFAQLYMGMTEDALAPVGAAVYFRTGAAAGYFPPSGMPTDRIVESVAPGATGVAQVRAWEAAGGDTYEAAMAAGALTGMSASFAQATGGDGAPPSLPKNMVNFTSFSLVPEPSTAALGILGAVAFMLRRRK